MDKIKVGILRSLNYYYFGDMWDFFFSKLGVDIDNLIVSIIVFS